MYTRAQHDQNAREGRHTHPPGERVGDLALWTGVLLGPAAWAVALLAGYALTGRECTRGTMIAIIVLHVAAFVATVVGFVVARRCRDQLHRPPPGARRDGGEGEPRSVPALAGPVSVLGRQRLMAHGGMIISALTVVIILGHGVAMIMLGVCR